MPVLLRLVDGWMRQRPGVIGYGTEVGKVDPSAALRTSQVVVGGLGRRPAQPFVKVSAPEVRPHEKASLARTIACDFGFLTLIQSGDRRARRPRSSITK